MNHGDDDRHYMVYHQESLSAVDGREFHVEYSDRLEVDEYSDRLEAGGPELGSPGRAEAGALRIRAVVLEQGRPLFTVVQGGFGAREQTDPTPQETGQDAAVRAEVSRRVREGDWQDGQTYTLPHPAHRSWLSSDVTQDE